MLAGGLVSAIAVMFAGLTLANVVGVSAGTALDHGLGWRVPFVAIAGLGLLSLSALADSLPGTDEQRLPLIDEVRELADWRLWVALLMTVVFSATIFVLFSYLAPSLGEVTGVSPGGVSLTSLAVGVSERRRPDRSARRSARHASPSGSRQKSRH